MPREGVAVFALATEPGLWVPARTARQYGEQLGASVILFGDGFTPENFTAYVRARDPSFVFVESHGFPCSVTAQRVRPLVSTPPEEGEPKKFCPGQLNVELLRGRVVHFNACWTGARLGEVLVDSGVRAFFGTRKPFLFLAPRDGRRLDPISTAPFRAEYTVEVAVMNGLTAWEAHQARLRAYDALIEQWEASKHPASDLLVTVLQADKENAVFFGDRKARAFPRPERQKYVVVKMDTGGSGTYILGALVLMALLGGGGK